MFVLPRPPQHRDGRRAPQFSSRPVSATDVSNFTKGHDVCEDLLIHEDGTNWFPSAPSNRTTQAEFAARTLIIQSQLDSASHMRELFLSTRLDVLARTLHNFTFDEQWERECIEKDSRTQLWSLVTTTSREYLLERLVDDERVGRAAVEQLATAAFFAAVSSAEFISRRNLTVSCMSRFFCIRQEEGLLRHQALVRSTASSDYNVLVSFEQSCRQYIRRMCVVVALQTELLVEEAAMRKHLLKGFWESRRAIVEIFGENGFGILWACEGWLGYETNVPNILAAYATVIQSTFRGWLLRRNMSCNRVIL